MKKIGILIAELTDSKIEFNAVIMNSFFMQVQKLLMAKFIQMVGGYWTLLKHQKILKNLEIV